MAGWKDILIDTIKLTDEVKRLNQQVQSLSNRTIDIDKRIVRLETLVEVAKYYQTPIKRDSLEHN